MSLVKVTFANIQIVSSCSEEFRYWKLFSFIRNNKTNEFKREINFVRVKLSVNMAFFISMLVTKPERKKKENENSKISFKITNEISKLTILTILFVFYLIPRATKRNI